MKNRFLIVAMTSFSFFTGTGFAVDGTDEDIKPIESLPTVEWNVEEVDESVQLAWAAYREYMMDIIDVMKLRNSVTQQAKDPDLADNGWLYRSRQKQILNSILADYGIMADSIYKWTSDSRNMKIQRHARDLYKEIYNTIQMMKRKDVLSNNNVAVRVGSFAKKIDMLTNKHVYNIQEDLKDFSDKGIDTAPFISTMQIISKNG